MKYAPSIWDFQSGFFLIERAKEPYFLLAQDGRVLRFNRVGGRLLQLLKRTQPQTLEAFTTKLHELLAKPTQKAMTLFIGKSRKRVLRATPVACGTGFLVEIDHA